VTAISLSRLLVHVPVSIGRSCRYMVTRVRVDRVVSISDRGEAIRTIFLSGLLLSVVGIGVLTAVHQGGASSMVHSHIRG